MTHLSRFLLLLSLTLGSASCSSLGWFGSVPDELDLDEVGPKIERARTDLANGNAKRAMDWMEAAVATPGMPPAQKREARELLEESARARIAQLATPPAKPKQLAGFLNKELPRQISVRAALVAAEEYANRGDRVEAFRVIKKLDQKYPTHHLRAEAGRILADVGLAIAADDSNFLFFFPRRARAKEVLEYMVVNYPSEPRCDEAYSTLGWLFERNEEWERAIEHHQDLLLYHPESAYAIDSEARIPKLRLISITSPEYDRQELVRARDELVNWLKRHEGDENEEAVRLDLGECYLRLHESDMGIARFYKRVDNDFGARFHGNRAAEEARLAGDEERESKALAFVAKLPPEEPRAPLENPATGGAQ